MLPLLPRGMLVHLALQARKLEVDRGCVLSVEHFGTGVENHIGRVFLFSVKQDVNVESFTLSFYFPLKFLGDEIGRLGPY